MSLCLWQCVEPGCQRTCVGKGGSVGLRAIGWYHKDGPDSGPLTGPVLYCPIHRPDTTECRDKPGHQCPQCTAELSVRKLQPKLMTDEEQDTYLREILPILQRQDLDRAVRAADGRKPVDTSHDPSALCEHGVWEYGGCKNADCHNCVDNIDHFRDLGPIEPEPRLRMEGW